MEFSEPSGSHRFLHGIRPRSLDLYIIAMHQTPATLLNRLCQTPSDADWARFMVLFTPLFHRWVRRFGASESDAEDLLQELFSLLWVQLPKFQYDPQRSFRAWVWTICRRLVQAKRRQQVPIPVASEALSDIAGPDEVAQFDEAEYNAYLIERGLAIVRADFPETTWRVFLAIAVEGRPGVEVAKEFNLSPNAVYLTRARVLARLRAELTCFRE